MKRVIESAKAPMPKGAYSQGIAGDGLIFLSGQLPTDPQTNEFVERNIAVQTQRTLKNIEAVLEAEGATLADVVKVSVFLRSLDDFAEMNRVYSEFFTTDPPARTTVAVADLPGGALLEIDAIALSRKARVSPATS